MGKSQHPLTVKAFGVEPKEAKKIEAEMNAKLAESWKGLGCCQKAAMTLGIRMFQYGIKNLEQLRELQNLLNHLIHQDGDKLSIAKALMDLMEKVGEKPAEAK